MASTYGLQAIQNVFVEICMARQVMRDETDRPGDGPGGADPLKRCFASLSVPSALFSNETGDTPEDHRLSQ